MYLYLTLALPQGNTQKQCNQEDRSQPRGHYVRGQFEKLSEITFAQTQPQEIHIRANSDITLHPPFTQFTAKAYCNPNGIIYCIE